MTPTPSELEQIRILELTRRREMEYGYSVSQPTAFIPQKPTPRQKLFLDLKDEKEVFYGGAAAGGKSSALLMSALEYVDVPNYSALLLRRTYADLSKQGALMDRAKEWLSGTGAQWNEQRKTWTFPSGARLAFGYLETENDKYQYQGAEYQFCVEKGTPVLMADGLYKPIEQLEVGELVQTLEGAKPVARTRAPRFEQSVEVDLDGKKQVQSITHPFLTTHGWLSYGDIVFASRLSAFSLSILDRDVHKSASPSLRQFPSFEQLLSDQCLDCQRTLEQLQSHFYHQFALASAACTAQSNAGNGFLGFAYELLKSSPSPSICRVLALLQRLLRSGVGGFLRHAFDCADRSAPPVSLLLDFLADYSKDFHLCDERLHQPLENVQFAPLQLADAVAHNPNNLPLGGWHGTHKYIHSGLRYDHPYRTEDKRQSSEPVSVCSVVLSPCGIRELYDITVTDSSHYITTTGLVNQNCGFDELSQFTETQYTYLFSRLRKLKGSAVPIRMRSASNPGGVGSKWVNERFIPEGFTPEDATEEKVWSKFAPDEETGEISTRFFVPARLDDNPHLDQKEYELSLSELDPVTRAQLRRGDWQISVRGDILYMWSEPHVVITWSQFENVFGVRHIPHHWLIEMYQDWGTTKDHPCVTSWFATAGANAPTVNGVKLAGSVFLFRGYMTEQATAREVGERLLTEMKPLGELSRLRRFEMSHEASSERLEYIKLGLPARNWKTGKTRGIEQFKNAITLRGADKRHPFNPSFFGHPLLYYIVDDDQLINPKDDRGLARWRAEAPAYKWLLPKSGEPPTALVPYALFNDANDTVRAAAANYFPDTKELTEFETIEEAIRERSPSLTIENLVKASPHSKGFTPAQEMARAEAESRVRKELGIEKTEPGWLYDRDERNDYESSGGW